MLRILRGPVAGKWRGKSGFANGVNLINGGTQRSYEPFKLIDV